MLPSLHIPLTPASLISIALPQSLQLDIAKAPVHFLQSLPLLLPSSANPIFSFSNPQPPVHHFSAVSHLLPIIATLTLFNMLAPLFLLFLSAVAQNTTAPVTQNNPSRAIFQAVLQNNKPVQGQITGVSGDNGTGVNFNINFFSFPDISVGPFSELKVK
jgi:hypothetical protein